MSGQPLRYAKDPAMYRQQYMDGLSIRSSLDDMVLQAVKTYKATGQLPAISSIPDNRTTTEKLADVEKLKIELIADLKPLMDSQMAQAVVEGVQNSPYNTDGGLFKFFAQQAPNIVKTAGVSYKYKISGDNNDIFKFVGIVENMYASAKGLGDTAKKFFNTSGQPFSGFTPQAYDAISKSFALVATKLMARFNQNVTNNQALQPFDNAITDLIAQIIERLEWFGNIISREPTVAHLSESAIGRVNASHRALTPAQNRAVIQILEYSEIYPKPSNLESFILKLNTILHRSDIEKLTIDQRHNVPYISPSTDNFGLVVRILQDMLSIIPPIDNDITRAFETVDDIDDDPPDDQPINDNQPVGASEIQEQYFKDIEATKTKPTHSAGSKPVSGNSERIQALQEAIDQLGADYTRERNAIDILRQDIANGGDDPAPLRNALETRLRQRTERLNDIERRIEEYEVKIGNIRRVDASGEGLRKRRGRPKGSGVIKPFTSKVDLNQGITAHPRYISFGKYVVNTNKLNDNIVSIKTPKGASVIGYPSYKTSPNLSNVLKKIVGGGLPTFNEMSSLTPSEQKYLYDVSKKSDILSKLNIPAPSRDQQDKDNHQFEVMRGEIMSGNDNKDLVRKFKILILKMSKSGDLPKAQVSELLADLAELGF